MCNTLLAFLTTCNLATAPAPLEITPAIASQAAQSLAYAVHAFVYPPSVAFANMGCEFPAHKGPRKGQLVGDIACEAVNGTYTVTVTRAPSPVRGGCSGPTQLAHVPLTVRQTCGNVTYTMEIATNG